MNLNPFSKPETHSIWQSSFPQNANNYADVLIVGGGLAGLSTAFWLKQVEPHLNIILLEAQFLGFGASGRNVGFILQGSANEFATEVETYGATKARRLWQFTKENRDLLLEALTPSAFDAVITGSFIAAGSEAEAQRLEHSATLLAALGEEVTYLEATEANVAMQSEGFYGALFVPTNGQLNPIKLVHHLAERAAGVQISGHGFSVYEHCQVLGFGKDGCVKTTKGDFYAPKVVCCLNAYLPLLMPEYAELVQPKRAQVMAFRAELQAANSRYEPICPPIYSHEGYYYIRQLADGTVLAGGARHLHRDAEVGYEDKTTEALQADLRAYVTQFFPKWATKMPLKGQIEPQRIRQWSGTMGFSPDFLPIVCELPRIGNIEQAFWMGAFSGHGLGFSFRMGKMMAERLTNTNLPAEWDLFDAKRFSL